jgi:putative membrane protein
MMVPWLSGWLSLWLVAGQVLPVMAREVAPTPVEPKVFVPALTWAGVVASIVYGLLGLILLLIGYYTYELITPWSVKEELITHRNPAVAIVLAGFILGMAVVIAAAIL